MTTTIPFIAYEISGVKLPTYGSGAANKAYVDSQVVAGGGVAVSAFQTLTASTGVTPFTSTVKVSSSTTQTLSVLGYSTISSNAKKGQASGSLLGTWVGSPNITTVGTIGTGTWNATSIAYSKLDAGVVNISSTAHRAQLSAQTALLDADFGTNGIMTRTGAGVYSYTTDNSTQWNAIAGSGNEYSTDYAWYGVSASKLSKAYKSASTGLFQLHSVTLDSVAASTYTGDDAITTLGTIGTGTWQGTTVKYTYLDATALPNISSQAQKAHASAQLLKRHAFDAKISSSYLAANYGWSNITSGSLRIIHSLSGTPNIINVTPSGSVTFAYAVYNPNATNFTIAITAAGSRVIRWHAQI
jgi:hypothetical protein